VSYCTDVTPLQVSPCSRSPRRRFHHAPDFTPRQIAPPRSPDCSPRQISPPLRLHPAADFTAPQMSPRPRFHRAPDVTLPLMSPLRRFHPHPDFTPPQISPRASFQACPHPPRLGVLPDQRPVQIQVPIRAAARADLILAQKTPLRRKLVDFLRRGREYGASSFRASAPKSAICGVCVYVWEERVQVRHGASEVGNGC